MTGKTLNTALKMIIVFIFLIVAITTIINFSERNTSYIIHLFEKQNERTARAIMNLPQYESLKLGKLRTHTGDFSADSSELPTSVVLVPYIFYSSGDAGFTEELNKNTLKIKKIIETYFTRYTKEALLEKGEANIKRDLLGEINSILSMNTVKEILFYDYMFLD